MPRVSKVRQLSSKKKSLFIDDFYSAITSFKNKDEARAFFEDLLTYEEKLMLGKRFQIAMMLKLDYLWSEITERVKITSSTIAKVNQRIKIREGGLFTVAQRIVDLKEKKLKQWQQKSSKEFLAPAIVKAGLGVLIKSKQRIRKSKSVTS